MIYNSKRQETTILLISRGLVQSNMEYYAAVKKKKKRMGTIHIYYCGVNARIKCEVKKASWRQVCKVCYCSSKKEETNISTYFCIFLN